MATFSWSPASGVMTRPPFSFNCSTRGVLKPSGNSCSSGMTVDWIRNEFTAGRVHEAVLLPADGVQRHQAPLAPRQSIGSALWRDRRPCGRRGLGFLRETRRRRPSVERPARCASGRRPCRASFHRSMRIRPGARTCFACQWRIVPRGTDSRVGSGSRPSRRLHSVFPRPAAPATAMPPSQRRRLRSHPGRRRLSPPAIRRGMSASAPRTCTRSSP